MSFWLLEFLHLSLSVRSYYCWSNCHFFRSCFVLKSTNEKNAKENDFLIFDCLMKNLKIQVLIKLPRNIQNLNYLIFIFLIFKINKISLK